MMVDFPLSPDNSTAKIIQNALINKSIKKKEYSITGCGINSKIVKFIFLQNRPTARLYKRNIIQLHNYSNGKIGHLFLKNKKTWLKKSARLS